MTEYSLSGKLTRPYLVAEQVPKTREQGRFFFVNKVAERLRDILSGEYFHHVLLKIHL